MLLVIIYRSRPTPINYCTASRTGNAGAGGLGRAHCSAASVASATALLTASASAQRSAAGRPVVGGCEETDTTGRTTPILVVRAPGEAYARAAYLPDVPAAAAATTSPCKPRCVAVMAPSTTAVPVAETGY